MLAWFQQQLDEKLVGLDFVKKHVPTTGTYCCNATVAAAVASAFAKQVNTRRGTEHWRDQSEILVEILTILIWTGPTT
jgi:hypothetical protein